MKYTQAIETRATLLAFHGKFQTTFQEDEVGDFYGECGVEQGANSDLFNEHVTSDHADFCTENMPGLRSPYIDLGDL